MATVVQKRRRRTRKLTEAEFMRLPDDGRKYELVDGEAKEAPTSFLHGVIGMRVAMLLQTYLTTPSCRFPLRAGGTAPAWFPSRSGGNLKEGGEKPNTYLTIGSAGYRTASGNIRVPDVGVIFKQSLPEGKLPDGFGDRAPDLAIEIVSPTEDMPDLLRKVGEYFESGAQEVWLLFPETQRVVRYTAPFEATILHAADELSTPLAPDFRMRVAELFAVE